MTYNLKKESEKKERLAGGHRLCAGCGAGITVRGVLRALDPEDKAVVVNATSCLEVSTFMYPYTAYEDSCKIEHDISDLSFEKIKEHLAKHTN